MRLLKTIHGWIKKESPFEDDSNSMLFLVRFLLYAWIPYYTVVFFYTLTREFYFYAATVGIATLVMISTLALSYKVRIRICALITCITIIALTYILTTGFGWRSSFQNMIYIAFLILWYDAMMDIRLKLLLSVMFTTVICIISYSTPFGGTLLDPSTVEYVTLVYFNIMVFSICLSLVAYFYCTLYVDVEKSLRINNRKLKEMSETDALTKLVNRRYAQQELAALPNKNKGNLISIAIGDIDLFKNVNDTYSHECGDYVLSTLAGIFKEVMSKQGFVARWGGEEFLFVFTNKNGDEALLELEKLRATISKTELKYRNETFNVTMTFGLEEFSPRIGVTETLEKADEKLYIGKQSGRNRTIY